MAGNTCSPSVADAGSDKEFTLIAFFAPSQVVFSTSGIESQEMSGQHFTVFTTLAASQPIASFQTAHQHLHTVLAPVELPPRERIFSIYRPTLADRHFYFHIRHQCSVKQKIGFQCQQGTSAARSRYRISLRIHCFSRLEEGKSICFYCVRHDGQNGEQLVHMPERSTVIHVAAVHQHPVKMEVKHHRLTRYFFTCSLLGIAVRKKGQ